MELRTEEMPTLKLITQTSLFTALTNGVDDQKSCVGVVGNAIGSIEGEPFARLTNVASSALDGKRQLVPASDKEAQYKVAALCVYVAPVSTCCHVSVVRVS